MRRIPIAARVAALAAVVVGAGVAFALPAGADVASLSPPVAAVQIGSPANLEAKGAKLIVPVTTVCSPGSQFADLNVQVVETVGSDLARGDGFVRVSCTGGFTTTDVVVVAENKPFKSGTAVVTAFFTACNSGGCNSDRDQRDVRVVH